MLFLVPFLVLSVAHADENLFERGTAEGKTPYQILKDAYKYAKPVKIDAALAECTVDNVLTEPGMRELDSYVLADTKTSDLQASGRFTCLYKKTKVIQEAKPGFGKLFPAQPAITGEVTYLVNFHENQIGTITYVEQLLYPITQGSSAKPDDQYVSKKIMSGLDEVLVISFKEETCGEVTRSITYREIDGDFISLYSYDCHKDPKKSESGYDYRFRK